MPGDASLVSLAVCRGNWSLQTPYRALPRASIAGEHAVREEARVSDDDHAPPAVNTPAPSVTREIGSLDDDDSAPMIAVVSCATSFHHRDTECVSPIQITLSSMGAAIIVVAMAVAYVVYRKRKRMSEVRQSLTRRVNGIGDALFLR